MEKLKVSIIIATRNRNQLLEKTIISLNNQSFKNNFEVLICDDGGNTNTDKLVSKYSKGLNIKYYWCKDLGEYCWTQAKNFGARQAKAKYLFFMDDDILIPSYGIKIMYSWLTRFSWRNKKYFVTPRERLYVYNNFPNNLITSDYKNISNYHIDNYSNKVTLGCAGLIHRDIFDKIGGFDEILFRGLQLGDTDIIKRLEGFLSVRNKYLPIQVYHLDNDPFRDKRNIIAIQRKNIAKQLIKEKLQLMKFKFKNLDDRPQKNKFREKINFYNNLLNNPEELKKISLILRKRLFLYDNPKNYFTPHIRK